MPSASTAAKASWFGSYERGVMDAIDAIADMIYKEAQDGHNS